MKKILIGVICIPPLMLMLIYVISYQYKLHNTLCHRKTFSEELEYIGNEQAVYYYLDDNNIYENKIDMSENKFMEYMETKGWEYNVRLNTDFTVQTIILEFNKNNIEIWFSARANTGYNKYFDFDGIFLDYILENQEIILYASLEKNEYKKMNDEVESIEKFKIITSKEIESISQNYHISLSDAEKYAKEGEEIAREFVLDIQNYISMTCNNEKT